MNLLYDVRRMPKDGAGEAETVVTLDDLDKAQAEASRLQADDRSNANEYHVFRHEE